MPLNLPTTLTVFRLCAALGISVVFVMLPAQYSAVVALSLFAVASITDWLDGFIARRWKQETELGAMLDPIADKALVLVSLFAIIGLHGLNMWLFFPAIIIVFREILVSGIREFVANKNTRISVTFAAKIKTTIQLIAIAGLLFSGCIASLSQEWHNGIYSVSVIFLWVAAGLTMFTGWDYFRKSVAVL